MMKCRVDLSLRRAAILMGPRRAGNTGMISHSIKLLINSGVDTQKIKENPGQYIKNDIVEKSYFEIF